MAQPKTTAKNEVTAPRMRVIIDNDFGGDPDGLFHLVQQLLSPAAEVKAIIGSRLYSGGFYESPGTAAYACDQVKVLLKTMALPSPPPVYMGAESGLPDVNTPSPSEGADAIIKEALSDDKRPLYILCGASLTTIASAYLKEPKIAEKIKLVWIGGPEYAGLATPPPNYQPIEYNLGIDIKAGQVIFNTSDIPLWQIPRDAYRQALVSYAELQYKVAGKGKTGALLVERIENILKKSNRTLGEAYVLGDSPLVLLTALQSGWEADPASSKYVVMQAPKINDAGQYLTNHNGRNIRVYTDLDIRLMMEDFYAKIALFSNGK
ncbi:twin-arginine translocation pathway signal protein [Flavobacterium akiainvivens]|uniref:Twin-arginine translocation pathway signal protein n=2 Tax=Flavobacterium akiainvivens TaxID=1202724 RepID=A0A0M8ME69_9FLAO|nr:twin-arginine translocation pathway signal protein [Flavobacterium akiainvivens]